MAEAKEKKETKKAKTTKSTDKAKSEKAPAKKSTSKAKADSFLEYKGKPLVRSGDTIYYGSMSDPYVVCLNIISSKEENGVKVSEKVAIQLLDTDPDVSFKDKVVKKSEKQGLYTALDLGAVWLERALKK